jgi:hypothetical protein
MIKYIVTWIVISIQSAPCPDINRNSDLGLSSSMITCTALHMKTVKTNHEKAFTNKDSADVFVKRLQSYENNYIFSVLGQERISDIKINIVK